MSPADRCRSGSSGTGTSRVPGLPPSSRSAARSLEQLQQEAQASGACASSQSCGSTEEMGAQENHTPGLGPRDSFDPVVTARPMSPASCAVVMPVIQVSSVAPVSASTDARGVDAAVRALLFFHLGFLL